MARGRSHLPSTIEHLCHSMFQGYLERSTLHGICGRTQFRVAKSVGHSSNQTMERYPVRMLVDAPDDQLGLRMAGR